MSNVKKASVVVAGEASESDDDEQQRKDVDSSQAGEDAAKKDVTTAGVSGTVVSGEASESDEEFEVVTSDGVTLPPLNVNEAEKATTDTGSPVSPAPAQKLPPKSKYNSLLNRKLRERNIALRRHLVDTVHQSFTIAAKDIHNLTMQLQKSHIAIQDVSHNMREATNTLFYLEDKVDIVRHCMILPQISFPRRPSVQPQEAASM
ncbi:biogenesis of lysosome-related organelles complex 1 subunit 3-like [Dreissena polymorpha]|uniref:Biogenesis of lysosome-related organelles complex 1 subunit 3 n=1 Tax=Dreissena polymorpha TaxID=45954 RepID=A0A9D4D4V2_DREPO|nr:biogenesis of lysosome-related organelles complex 1 subunit 3-like [Dreissena polymorpha]KAH3739063.1 hypothetical protein DPMN_045709 [Dreissena polymorpha]